MSDSGEYYRITCRFCDTILTVEQDQAGKEIKCPDCFSMLTVGPPPTTTKTRSAGRGGRSWKSDDKSIEPGASGSEQVAGNGSESELKLSETFERPVVSPLFGLDASEEDLLAPKKKKPSVNAAETPAANSKKRSTKQNKRPNPTPESPFKKDASPTFTDAPVPDETVAPSSISESDTGAGLDVDLPLPVNDVLSLDAIGKLDPDSESKAAKKKTSASRATGATSKKRVVKQSQVEPALSDQEQACRPKFKHANLFMATVGMLTDFRVLAASGVAVLVMLIGGISSEIIFPVGSNTEALTITTSMYKYFISFLFGNLPYYFGLLGLWTIAGIVFQHAAQGHVKVQQWAKAGKTELWSSFLLFSFSFFIAGLPGAILQIMIIPLRMLVAPLFLISAWFNYSPWQIISTDWYHAINENKSQWITVYSCFAGLAFVGLLTGAVFWARSSVELVAVDLILTFIGIVSNAVITLVFAAIAGWHTGAVIESLDQGD